MGVRIRKYPKIMHITVWRYVDLIGLILQDAEDTCLEEKLKYWLK